MTRKSSAAEGSNVRSTSVTSAPASGPRADVAFGQFHDVAFRRSDSPIARRGSPFPAPMMS